MTLDWYVIWDYRADLLSGLWLTIRLSVAAIVGATLVGLFVGCIASVPGFLWRRLAALYVELMRNIPIIVKLFFAHFVVGIDALPAGILVLVMHQSAYIADVTAAGLRSVPIGQTESAMASGLTYRQIFGNILLPQAAPVMLAPLLTQYAQIVKNSSVVMLVALQDLTFMAQRIEQKTFRGIEAMTTATGLYILLALLIMLAMSAIQRLLEQRAR